MLCIFVYIYIPIVVFLLISLMLEIHKDHTRFLLLLALSQLCRACTPGGEWQEKIDGPCLTCLAGNYCQTVTICPGWMACYDDARLIPCDPGHMCPDPGMSSPLPCTGNTYQKWGYAGAEI